MLQKTIDKLRHKTAGLRDIRTLGLLLFVVIVLLVSWSGVKAVQTNAKLEQQIVRLQQENTVQKLKNDNQRLRNQYYNTPQYLELAARQNFGLAAPGEKVLLVPKDVAERYVADVPQTETLTEVSKPDTRPFFMKNLQAWSDFFLHRNG